MASIVYPGCHVAQCDGSDTDSKHNLPSKPEKVEVAGSPHDRKDSTGDGRLPTTRCAGLLCAVDSRTGLLRVDFDVKLGEIFRWYIARATNGAVGWHGLKDEGVSDEHRGRPAIQDPADSWQDWVVTWEYAIEELRKVGREFVWPEPSEMDREG